MSTRRLNREHKKEQLRNYVLNLGDEEDLKTNPEIRRLILAISCCENSAVLHQLEKKLALLIGKQRIIPFLESLDGKKGQRLSVQIGHSITGDLFFLDQDRFTNHLLVIGQSGAGKTTLFYNLKSQLLVPFWSFDLKKDYRHAIQRQDNLLILPWSRLRFNPLKPPEGVSPRRWAQVFSEIFAHSTSLLSGSKNHLLKQICELYRVYGLFDWVSPPYPSLHELQDLVEHEKINYVRTSSDYRDRLLNRLEAMNLAAGTIFDCSQGYSIEELLKRNVVFEFDGLNRDVQNFLMEILFAYVYEYRLAQNQRGGDLRHVFFLDEGKRVFSVYKERQDASGIPEIDDLTAKMREFGEGLIVGDQEASKLTDSIKANTYTKVLLPTGDRKQFNAVAESMNLSERQAEAAQQLGIGEAIVQVGNREPVPVKLNDYPIDKDVTDQELREKQQEKWSHLYHTPRDPIPEFEQRVMTGHRREDEPIPDDPSQKLEITEGAEKLLQDVVQNPFRCLSDRYDDLSSTYKGNKAKNELVENGLVVERQVKTQENKRKLLQLTEKGREYVENHLNLDVSHNGRGGIVHRYWQHRIQESFETRGWNVSLEKEDADIHASKGNTDIAIEVAMGNNPREIEHVEKHLDQFDQVYIACRNREVLTGLQQRLQENGLATDRVKFREFPAFLGSESPPT